MIWSPNLLTKGPSTALTSNSQTTLGISSRRIGSASNTSTTDGERRWVFGRPRRTLNSSLLLLQQDTISISLISFVLAFAGNQPLISTMRAMILKKRWFSSILEQAEVKIPEIKDNEVMIKVCASGVNRGDIIDVVTSAKGVCPGLECSGIIEAVGRDANCWKVGERVCAILEGGGFAEKVVVPADFLLPLPDDIDLADAAGLAYASCSIWPALFEMCDPEALKDKTILIREGPSGIGALAIQYAKYMGLTVIASTGSSDTFSMCHDYGADICLDHTSKSFVREVVKKAGYLGVDFVLDYGASDLQRNIECCRHRGKVFIVDLHGMLSNSIDLAMLEKKQAEIKVFDLRSRDLGSKASVIAQVRTHLWPSILTKKVIPVVGNRFAVTEAQKALNLLKENDNIEKIIVHMNFEKTSRHLKMD